jgi:hypothetical protein
MASRLLTDAEIEFARQVFEDRLPYKKIHIANYYLPGNQGVAVTMASLGSLIATRTRRSYAIYFGPDVFTDGAHAPRTAATFIHELTHVWQGYHRKHSWEFMVESMLAQGHALVTTGDRDQAYAYTPGGSWDSYNVEQQALIVQDWFTGGMKTDDERFHYVRDHIRAGRN